jgi:magnesium-transporting ATPase (P-type)
VTTSVTSQKTSARDGSGLRGVGYVTRTLVYLALALLLWSSAPDISQRPLGSLTVDEGVRSLLFLFFAFIWWRCFFNPNRDRDPLSIWSFNYWEAWGALGLTLVGIAVLAAAWFSRDSVRAWIDSWADPVGNAINTFSNSTIGEWLGNILFLGVIIALQIFFLAIIWAYVRSIYRWAAAKVRGRY